MSGSEPRRRRFDTQPENTGPRDKYNRACFAHDRMRSLLNYKTEAQAQGIVLNELWSKVITSRKYGWGNPDFRFDLEQFNLFLQEIGR